MTRVQMTQAVAADYADALLVARKAKNTLFLLLAVLLLAQMGVFIAARYVPGVDIRAEPVSSQSTTQPALTASETPASTTTTTTTTAATRPSEESGIKALWRPGFQYVLACTGFLGIVLSLALAAILFVIAMIMLVGRLVGVTHLLRAFCWSVLFIILLFPWQSLLSSPVPITLERSASGENRLADEARDPRIPGVLYTFSELQRDYDFPAHRPQLAILKWARYVGFPVMALLVLLTIQRRSRRGLRYALGEVEIPLEPGGRGV